MINRWFLFLVVLLLGGGIGLGLAATQGLIVGVVLASLAWLTVDSLNASRFVAWLRHELSNESSVAAADLVPKLPGIWGLSTERVYKLLVKRDRLLRDSQSRLDEFLLAMQASPNGVVLLDAQDRIEWCNQMAAQHFGFDATRYDKHND